MSRARPRGDLVQTTGARTCTFLGIAAIAGALTPHDASAQGPTPFKKGPYLQELSSNAVSIRFELESKGPASVDVTHEGDPAITIADRDESIFHSVRVEKLKPATRYQYVVRALGATSAKGEIVTAPTDDSHAPFSFVVYGDNRTDVEAHAVVVRAMKQSPSDFLLNTGDFVQSGGSASDWQSFFDVESTMLRDRCVFSAIGNHELFEDRAAAAYARYLGPTAGPSAKLYGTMRWSNARFFFLNAFDDWSGGEQRAWLDNALALADTEPGLRWRFAIVHHGAWSSGPHGSSPKLTAAGVHSLLAAHKIDLLVSGHDHVYERGDASGLRYVVSGGGGAPLYRQSKPLPSTRKFEATYHFVEVAVTDEAVKLVAKRADGSVIERCGFGGARGWDCDPNASPPASGPMAPQVLPASDPPASAAPAAAPSRCGCGVVGERGTTGGVCVALATVLLSLFRDRRQRR